MRIGLGQSGPSSGSEDGLEHTQTIQAEGQEGDSSLGLLFGSLCYCKWSVDSTQLLHKAKNGMLGPVPGTSMFSTSTSRSDL